MDWLDTRLETEHAAAQCNIRTILFDGAKLWKPTLLFAIQSNMKM